MRIPVCIGLMAGLLALAPPVRGDELRVLTYNVHGLPSWAAGDDPEARFPAIGPLLGAFDLVLLQEDFAHHESLRRSTPLATLRRGNPSQHPFCPICNGAGLTIGAGDGTTIDTLLNRPYTRCAGWLGGGNDCIASKGFQLARVRTPGGAILHVLNTHLDSGREEADRDARGAQLEEIVAAVRETVGDGALLLAGDLNLLTGNSGDDALRSQLMAALSLDDSGARTANGSPFTVLDYMLLRSGSDTELRVLEAGEDLGFSLGDAPLSDHPALYVVLELRPRR